MDSPSDFNALAEGLQGMAATATEAKAKVDAQAYTKAVESYVEQERLKSEAKRLSDAGKDSPLYAWLVLQPKTAREWLALAKQSDSMFMVKYYIDQAIRLL